MKPGAEDGDVNRARYGPEETGGHYESFFLRANHPARPLAFWIRYTTFSPRGRPEDAVGELWAVWFDGERGAHVAVKRELPRKECALSRTAFDVRIGDAVLAPGRLDGEAASGGHRVAWSLAFAGESPPLRLLPPRLYDGALPRAKALVGLPGAVFRGWLRVDGREIPIEDWAGSQNHNWGSRHTDRYAWGQVAGFDEHPQSFLELASGSLRVGPLWTPLMTLLVLRHEGREYAFRSLGRALRARAAFECFAWRFETGSRALRVSGAIEAPAGAFVGLRYANPPGGEKHCLNTKLAACRLTLAHADGRREELATAHRAAFEILTDDRSHGVAIRA